ncbi:unnamed protein product [Protopolystoma xenopodis]|uniref:Uncharacterized protein n=1 Tax=Protopolystoma xenopodis TaxID=117903 RepID=A0A448WYT8_9PLAT|nr:unnamed protein product [Protopolystoma xenopodis]
MRFRFARGYSCNERLPNCKFVEEIAEFALKPQSTAEECPDFPEISVGSKKILDLSTKASAYGPTNGVLSEMH